MTKRSQFPLLSLCFEQRKVPLGFAFTLNPTRTQAKASTDIIKRTCSVPLHISWQSAEYSKTQFLLDPTIFCCPGLHPILWFSNWFPLVYLLKGKKHTFFRFILWSLKWELSPCFNNLLSLLWNNRFRLKSLLSMSWSVLFSNVCKRLAFLLY